MTGPVRSTPRDLFRFAEAERSALYTALLYAFGEANDRLVTSLALDDVRTHLAAVGWAPGPDDTELVSALEQMRAWHLVDAGQNHAEQYRTAAEYERRNLQYSLTRQGEAALAGHVAAVAALESVGALATAVLEAITETLGRLVTVGEALPRAPVVPGTPRDEATVAQRRAYSTLHELDAHLDTMRTGVRTFNGDLQRLLHADEVGAGVFVEVKEATVRYLNEYVTRLDERAERIRRVVEQVRGVGLDRLLGAALVGADLPPHPDPAARDTQWLDHARSRWAGLESWFAPGDGSAPRVLQLSATARQAIVSLLQVVDRMRAARRRPSSLQADLRRLARLFATAPADDDLHRLWRAAFGLHPARHTHVGHADPELVPRGATWAQADPVPVSALLRETGTVEKVSRTPRVRDVTAVRAGRARAARAQREAAERALVALGADRTVRVSELERLDQTAFGVLLDLLGRALTARPRDGALRASSSDGQVEVTLRPPDDGRRTTVVAPTGRFECPDYELTIARVGARDLVAAL